MRTHRLDIPDPPGASGPLASLPFDGAGESAGFTPAAKPTGPDDRSNRSMGHAFEPPATPDSGPAAERALVARAGAGDPQAFGALVERHADRVYALALRFVRNPSDAEEVAQDAFVRAWRALPRFRGEAAFSTWLHRIVVRCAFDRLEILRGRRDRETDLDAAASAPGDGGDAARAPERRRIERLVGALPVMQRAVVSLYYLEDRSVQDVARALDLNANTVKTHLARARAALRAAWLREEEEA